jgi:hypothetical protein
MAYIMPHLPTTLGDLVIFGQGAAVDDLLPGA